MRHDHDTHYCSNEKLGQGASEGMATANECPTKDAHIIDWQSSEERRHRTG